MVKEGFLCIRKWGSGQDLTKHPGVALCEVERRVSISSEEKGLQGYLTYKKTDPLGPWGRTMSRVIGGFWGGGRFLMGEVPL